MASTKRVSQVKRAAKTRLSNASKGAGAKSTPKAWWQQDAAVTWPDFEKPEHRRWLGFVRDVGTTICDRGIMYTHNASGGDYRETPPGLRVPAVDYYHQQGMHVTSFLSVCNWKADDASVTDLIRLMRQELDDGCDGIHLDMLTDVDNPPANVINSDTAFRAIDRMRKAVHAYPRKVKAMFTGNAYMLERKIGPGIVRLTDVGWIENHGHGDLDLVRTARVARSVDNYTKPVWYHWQPDDNEQERVVRLVNLSKALYASLLMEGAVFLCNYQYPVPVLTYDKKGVKKCTWTFYEINDGWQEAVIQYARFAREHSDFYHNVTPVAPVLIAYNPNQIVAADLNMTLLLQNNIPFNVLVYGQWPFQDMLKCRELDNYKCVVTPDNASERKVQYPGAHLAVGDIMAGNIPGIHDFCRVEGAAHVVTRTFTQPGKMFVHLKQHGYTDQADALPVVGPLQLEVHCPKRVRSAVCLSPDRPGTTKLKFTQHGAQVRMTVPKLEYYNLIVLE
jgi:hypothetical protein